MGGTVSFPTDIVLEIPEPMATKVRRYRMLFDKERCALPTEITLTGSSGVGPISLGQDLEDVFSLIDSVSAKFEPFDAYFDNVEAFNSSDTYFLSFRNPEPFKRLHRAFAESGILFDPTPYPFTPHCTIKLHKRPEDSELFDLFFLKPPNGYFTLDTVSIYCLPNLLAPQLLHKIKLGAASSSLPQTPT